MNITLSRTTNRHIEKNNSTETLLHKVIIDILEGINDALLTSIALFDLAKCFDTIDHDILILKPEKYGVKSNVLSRFKSYLYDRTQLVKCDNSVSKSLPWA